MIKFVILPLGFPDLPTCATLIVVNMGSRVEKDACMLWGSYILGCSYNAKEAVYSYFSMYVF
jgi:hypothetical protein